MLNLFIFSRSVSVFLSPTYGAVEKNTPKKGTWETKAEANGESELKRQIREGKLHFCGYKPSSSNEIQGEAKTFFTILILKDKKNRVKGG